MKVRLLILVFASTLFSACGGSGGSSGDPKPPVLSTGNNGSVSPIVTSGTLRKDEVVHYFIQYYYGPTLIFYHYLEHNAVLLVRFPSTTADIEMSASLYIFDSGVSESGIRDWLENQISDVQTPNAPAPAKTFELNEGIHFQIDDIELIQEHLALEDELYNHYAVSYSFTRSQETGEYELLPFTDVTDVYQLLNNAEAITNTPLPIHENFSADSVQYFFSPEYRALATDGDAFIPLSHSGYPSFYYPTCCLFTSEQGASESPPLDNPEHFELSGKGLTIRNARFTIGQLPRTLPSEEMPDPRRDSSMPSQTPGRGELALSVYRISFCVVSAASSVPGEGRLYIWEDNNTDEFQPRWHGDSDTPIEIGLDELIPGQRFVKNIPGDIFVQAPYSVAEGGVPVATTEYASFGAHSYIQIYAQGGELTITDLVIEQQDEDNTINFECVAGASN